MKNNTPIIRITPVDGKPNKFVASFRSEFLDRVSGSAQVASAIWFAAT
jgi:hypothetical protein